MDTKIAERLGYCRVVVLNAQKVNPEAVKTSMVACPDGTLIPQYQIGNAPVTSDPSEAARLAVSYLDRKPTIDLNQKEAFRRRARSTFDPLGGGSFDDFFKRIFGK